MSLFSPKGNKKSPENYFTSTNSEGEDEGNEIFRKSCPGKSGEKKPWFETAVTKTPEVDNFSCNFSSKMSPKSSQIMENSLLFDHNKKSVVNVKKSQNFNSPKISSNMNTKGFNLSQSQTISTPKYRHKKTVSNASSVFNISCDNCGESNFENQIMRNFLVSKCGHVVCSICWPNLGENRSRMACSGCRRDVILKDLKSLYDTVTFKG